MGNLTGTTIVVYFGLLLDVFGAWLLAKHVVLGDAKSTADSGYIDNSNLNAFRYYGAERVKRKLDEMLGVKYGLCLLLTGLSCQAISPVVPGSYREALAIVSSLLFLLIFIRGQLIQLHYTLTVSTAAELLARIRSGQCPRAFGEDGDVIYQSLSTIGGFKILEYGEKPSPTHRGFKLAVGKKYELNTCGCVNPDVPKCSTCPNREGRSGYQQG